MIFLKALLIVVEVICCLLLIGLVLLQKSKSEGLGMAFGAGAGESLFGARAGNVLSKMTVVLGIVFIANTLALGVLFAQKEQPLLDPGASAAVPLSVQTQPIAPIDLVVDTGTAPAEETPVVQVPAETQEEM